MRIYTIYMEASVSAAKTLIEILNTAAVMTVVLGVGVTQDGSETSDQVTVELKRITATGTGTATTPVKRSPGDPAATFTAKTNDSAEPTYEGTDPVWSEGFNMLSGVSRDWSFMEAPESTPGTAKGWGLKLDTAPAGATTIRAWMRVAELG